MSNCMNCDAPMHPADAQFWECCVICQAKGAKYRERIPNLDNMFPTLQHVRRPDHALGHNVEGQAREAVSKNHRLALPGPDYEPSRMDRLMEETQRLDLERTKRLTAKLRETPKPKRKRRYRTHADR